jgi:hypothetical protein
MGITQRRAERHIREWEAKFAADGFRPHRVRWPSRLFHHSVIENAAIILSQGRLLSRIDSTAHRKIDIAGTSVIQNRGRAHQFGRLYFRPRTPTQWSVEGIRKPEAYWNGDRNAHAPTLAMFVFDARKILVQEGVRFSNGNMQSGDAQDGDHDEFFDAIDFAKVYHEGWHDHDSSITFSRCAEVLVPSPMAIVPCLTAIVCRSVAERLFLLDEMGTSAARRWSKFIHVSDDLNVFEKKYIFVDTVSIQNIGVQFKLHPAGPPAHVCVEIWDDGGRLITSVERKDTPPVAPKGGNWLVRAKLSDGCYRVRITIERCRAFDAELLLGDGLPF